MAVMLNGGPVMWKSRIQGANSMSTAESEVRALSYATAQVKWFKVFMAELEVPQAAVRVLEDNAACKAMVHKEPPLFSFSYRLVRGGSSIAP